jgi:predicted transcriptional regulator
MSNSSSLAKVLSKERLEQLSATFHMVNRLLPAGQQVLSVAPDAAAREALAIMRHHGYSQLPVVEGNAVLGIFSYRAFALEAAATEDHRVIDLPVEEFLEHEAASFARLTDEFRSLIDVLDERDCVVVSGPDELIALVTPMDVLRYLYKIANAFVLIEEIELSLRAVIQTALDNRATFRMALENALREKYGEDLPEVLEELTFDDYIALIRDGRNWEHFQTVLGGTRERARTKLEPVRDLRNDIFHFKRELAVQDHERLAACRDWLLRCIRKLEARRRAE